VQYTNRHPWGDFSLLHRLTPKHLATILSDVRRGECPVASLELAQDRELKDPHYRSVLSTRKDAITGLEIKGIPASDASHDTALAQALERDIVHNPKTPLRSLFRDMLDALAKGFSITEIIWNTTHIPWKPAAYKFRDPRWFQYDKETGTTLMLHAPYGITLEPLKPLHFVIHEPHLISGTQITSGLALPALYYWMLKSYDVASWAAFIDRYGYPIRIGKYGKKATERDIATLKRAVANIAADFGAVIPESALLEIIESKHARETATVHKNMADWVDKQLSKLILGQTMTTDEGSSKAQRETHEKVRDDIADSDSMQVVDTLHAQLTVPYIHLNFGEHGAYPKIDLFKPDEKNIEQIILAIEKIGPQGLTVKADEIRSILGLSKPDKGDEVIGGLPDPVLSDTADGPPKPHLNAVQTETPEELERLLEASTDSYIPITDDIAEVLETAASRATDFETFQEALLKLVKDWSPDTIAQCIALATFKARALGDAQFDQE
jgi:phage gp29-like protein